MFLTNSCINGHHNCPSPHCEPNGCSSGIDKRSNFSFPFFFFFASSLLLPLFLRSLSLSFRRATALRKCLNRNTRHGAATSWCRLSRATVSCAPVSLGKTRSVPCPNTPTMPALPTQARSHPWTPQWPYHPCHRVKNLGWPAVLVLLPLSYVAMASLSSSLCLAVEATNGGPLLAT